MSALSRIVSLRIVLLGLGALGFAALATLGANRYIADRIDEHQAQSRPAAVTMAKVVVAKYDLAVGEIVGPDNMALRDLPAEFLPGSAVRPERFESVSGMRLTRTMRSGEPLLQDALQSADPGGLSTRIRQGIRALSLTVDEVNSVSGMLRPGDRIDLLLTIRQPGGDASASSELTKPLLQDVLVLATGRKLGAAGEDGPGGRPFTTITMELGPEEAKRVVIAQRAGKITALLRNPDDRRPISEAAVDVGTLLGVPRAPSTVALPALGRVGPEVIVGGMGSIGSASARRAEMVDASAPPVVAPMPSAPASVAARPAMSRTSSAQAASPVASPAAMPPVPSMPPGQASSEFNQPRLFR